MGDRPRSPTTDFYSILGISKAATFKDMCKAYKSLVSKWHPDKNSNPNKPEAEAKFHEINKAYKAINEEIIKEKQSSFGSTTNPSATRNYHHKSMDESFFSRHSTFLKSASRKSRSPTLTRWGSRSANTSPTPTENHDKSSRSKSATRRRSCSTSITSTSSVCEDKSDHRSKSTRRTVSEPEFPDLSRNGSTRNITPSNPIVYSHSTTRKKPPPIEIKLDCTLEELCYGCVKHIKIQKHVLKHGILDKEEEILKIKVKPGWKKGTKIKFEERGDERPGYHPADIVFLINEIQHPLFEREGDDLVYEAEVPLVNALTGCRVSVPLLGGEQMCIAIDDIICPGYKKIIRGQGMSISNNEDNGWRGNLRVKFLVIFPSQLTIQQRSLAASILRDCCSS